MKYTYAGPAAYMLAKDMSQWTEVKNLAYTATGASFDFVLHPPDGGKARWMRLVVVDKETEVEDE